MPTGLVNRIRPTTMKMIDQNRSMFLLITCVDVDGFIVATIVNVG